MSPLASCVSPCPRYLGASKRVVRPGGGARIHFPDLQAARIDVPDVAVLAQMRVMKSAVTLGQRRNVILDEHGLARGLFINRLVGNGQPAFLAVRPEIFHQIGDQFLALSGRKSSRHEPRAGIVIRGSASD